MATYKYAAVNEAPVYKSISDNKGKTIVNRILMGTYVFILGEEGDWYKVSPFGTPGYMRKSDLGDSMGLKIFFLDVGQGDGMLLEVGPYKILIDAGPNNNMFGYLTKWQYAYLFKKNKQVHIDYLIVSHFDLDHYKGFIKVLAHQGFTFGIICHPGILKHADKENPFNTGLGNVVTNNGEAMLTKLYDNLMTISTPFAFNRDISNFLEALQKARAEGRVQQAKRFEAGNSILKKVIDGTNFSIEVLGPVTGKAGNRRSVPYFGDDGKTINGNSLVLKVSYGSRTFLLGGDLNSAAEKYLMKKYAGSNPFEVDVAKSCHHGSSDFTEEFMSLVNPYATVISSGDNESHAHPRADAIGCAGRYSKSKRPLVYSTELARSVNLRSREILFGMINLRCNGKDIYISQMKEAKKNTDLWDSYEVK